MSKVNKREEKKAAKEMSELPLPAPLLDANLGIQFAPDRYLSYTVYNGQPWVHVREFASAEGRAYPTKKGASFTPGRLRVLINKMDEIDEELRQQAALESYKVQKGQYRAHLGGGIYATVSSEFHGVDIRRYWVPPKQLSEVPTRNGIFLPVTQWRSLKVKIDELLKEHPDVAICESCFHQNQMGLFDCRECLPFGWAIKDINDSVEV